MINCIAAMSKNYQIGLNNQLPWHIPEDMKYFKELTLGKTVVMGRKTYESLGGPLPHRQNIILTRQYDYCVHPLVKVFHRLEDALHLCRHLNDVFIIGGGEIYRAFLPYTDKLYLTIVDVVIKGDVTFPNFKNQFACVDSRFGVPDDINIPNYTFTVWNRI